MKEVTSTEFLASIKNGDVGIICADNLFAKLQALYAHRFKEGPMGASHGFFMKAPPNISEANGIIISQGKATVIKNVGNKTKCWLFRYKNLTTEQLRVMNTYVEGAEATAGHYSVGGILQFAKSFFTGKVDTSDERGVFCTEYTSRIIRAAGLNYISDRDPWEIDPTFQLNWFSSPLAFESGWALAAHYDGKNFYTYLEGTGPDIPPTGESIDIKK